MARIIATLAFVLAACAPDRSLDDPPDSPDAGPPEPASMDGEYVILAETGLQYCGDETAVVPERERGVVDLVVQDDPLVFDLNTPYNGFLFFDLRDQSADPWDGGFSVEDQGIFYFVDPNYPLAWKRWMTDGRTREGLSFGYAFELGWDDENGDYAAYCRIESEVTSERRYALRNPVRPRSSIDAKWRTLVTVVEDSWLDEGEEPPAPRWVTLNTYPQAEDGSWFSLRGTYVGFDPLHEPDGTVAVFLWHSGGLKITLDGRVTEEELALDLAWHWFDPATGATYRFLHLRYDGVPRYDAPDSPVRARGEYLAAYRVAEDTCSGASAEWKRVVDVVPHGEGAARLRLTGFWQEPAVQMSESGGAFRYAFRRSWGYDYAYEVEGELAPETLAATIAVTRSNPYADPPGSEDCRVVYEVSNGRKRFKDFSTGR